MIHKTETKGIREEWIEFIHHLQNQICKQLEQVDGKALFIDDAWERPGGKGGGGLTKIIQNGQVFEKGGVNTSVVYGHVTERMRKHLGINSSKWFAAGLSVVVHPVNPFVPTVHCNYRMFELYNEEDMLADRWFGGGTDLTPYYLFDEDARHFHGVYKDICDEYDPLFYNTFKKQCDTYFANKHRQNERRGIGGIFYDHQRTDENHSWEFWMNFGKSCGTAFLTAYLPIVEKRKNMPFSEKHVRWQGIRRGRYVEFNLIHDRGTLFGLKTNGRTESILMSLPPTARFEYDDKPAAGTEEERLLNVCQQPVDWV